MIEIEEIKKIARNENGAINMIAPFLPSNSERRTIRGHPPYFACICIK